MVYSISDRAAGPLCEDALALVFGKVAEGEMPGAEFAGDEPGEVADLRRDLTKRADAKAGHASRVASAYISLSAARRVRLSNFAHINMNV